MVLVKKAELIFSLMTGQEEMDEKWNPKFHFNIETIFFILRVVKPWNRLSGQVVDSLSLELLRTKLDMVLSQPAPGTLLWAL